MLKSTLTCLLLSLLGVAAAEAHEPIEIRVVSYNIHHGEGLDDKLDLPRIAQVLEQANPDIIALQEVDQNTERTEKVDQTAVLAKLLKMNSVFGDNIDYQGGRYGNALLTKYDSISVTNHKLPALTPGEQRGLMEADIAVPGLNQPLKFLATHFDYRRDNKERVASCEMIKKLTQDWGDRPALMAGDLNALPDSETLRLLQEHWTRANKEVEPTFPSDKPVRQIDYILLRPASGWKVVEFQVLDEAVASDHRPILAVLQWHPAGE